MALLLSFRERHPISSSRRQQRVVKTFNCCKPHKGKPTRRESPASVFPGSTSQCRTYSKEASLTTAGMVWVALKPEGWKMSRQPHERGNALFRFVARDTILAVGAHGNPPRRACLFETSVGVTALFGGPTGVWAYFPGSRSIGRVILLHTYANHIRGYYFDTAVHRSIVEYLRGSQRPRSDPERSPGKGRSGCKLSTDDSVALV